MKVDHSFKTLTSVRTSKAVGLCFCKSRWKKLAQKGKNLSLNIWMKGSDELLLRK
jgi:hypothetical protein